MTAQLYLHPATDIPTAALVAYANGQHLQSSDGVVRLAAGRDEGQRLKALKTKALRTFNKSLQSS